MLEKGILIFFAVFLVYQLINMLLGGRRRFLRSENQNTENDADNNS